MNLPGEANNVPGQGGEFYGHPAAVDPGFAAVDGDNLVKENLYHCIKLVQENPSWLLSLQWHKFIGIE